MGDARSGVGAVASDGLPLELPEEPDTADLFEGDPGRGSPIEESLRAMPRAREKLAAAGSDLAPARRGRPPGAKNRITADVLRFIDHRYRDPLLGIMDVASMSPVALARLFVPDGYAVTEAALGRAWDMWRACVFEAAEYRHTKQPRAVTLTPDSAPLMSFQLHTDQLTMNGVGAGALDQVFGFTETAIKSMQSQGIGGEVLEGEVLETDKSAGNSNA